MHSDDSLGQCRLSTLRPSSIAKTCMRKRRKITTRKTQERYFQNSLGHPSLPTALFVLADSRHYLTMLRICRFKNIALSYKWCCSTKVRRRRPQNLNKNRRKEEEAEEEEEETNNMERRRRRGGRRSREEAEEQENGHMQPEGKHGVNGEG